MNERDLVKISSGVYCCIYTPGMQDEEPDDTMDPHPHKAPTQRPVRNAHRTSIQ